MEIPFNGPVRDFGITCWCHLFPVNVGKYAFYPNYFDGFLWLRPSKLSLKRCSIQFDNGTLNGVMIPEWAPQDSQYFLELANLSVANRVHVEDWVELRKIVREFKSLRH
jgi:hypothetical protein